jgi:hypothetical protein
MRQVPQRQIYGFSLPTDETMSRDGFRDKPFSCRWPAVWNPTASGSLVPVTNAGTNAAPPRAERRVVASKIRYLVLCYGVPLKIAPDPDSK